MHREIRFTLEMQVLLPHPTPSKINVWVWRETDILRILSEY